MIKMYFLETGKDTSYYIGYWITALLPVIIGFGLTMLLIWYLTKTYKGPGEDEEEDL